MDYKFTPSFWNKYFKEEHYFKEFPSLAEDKLTDYCNFFKIVNFSNSLLLKTDLYVEAKNKKDNYLPFLGVDKCVGMDISLEVVKNAKNNLSHVFPNMRFIVADVRNLPFKPDIFNVIISDSTLDHLPVNKLPAIMSDLNKIMRQNGKLILSLDNIFNFSMALRRRILRDHPVYYPAFSFNLNRVFSVLKIQGFRIVSWDYILPFEYALVVLIILSKRIIIIRPLALFWALFLKKINRIHFLKKFVCNQFIILAEKG